MRGLSRAGAGVALLLLLGSCTLSFPLDLVVRDGRLVITTEREWRWFLIPHRPPVSVRGIEVWDSEGWRWKVKEIAPGPGCVPTPFTYGAKLGGLEVEVPAKPLRRGRSYSIYVAGEYRFEVKSFAISSEGKLRWLPDEQVNPPPDIAGPPQGLPRP